MNTFKIALKYLSIAALLLSLLYSCKSTEKITTAKVKAMSTGRIIKNVEDNAFDYDFLTIKRISCLFEDENGRTSFKANLKSINNKGILLLISKLNISVGRLYLTPDSVIYINYMDKNYFLDDYSYLSSILNIDLDFETVQAILSNSIFSYRNDPKERDYKNFISYVEEDKYVIQSYKERKLSKIVEKDKYKKANRMLKKRDDEVLILQTTWIEPETFNLLKMLIEDKSNDRLAEFNFGDYTKIGKNDFPGEINLGLQTDKGNVSLKIRLAGFSTDKIKPLSFKIPEKYEELIVN